MDELIDNEHEVKEAEEHIQAFLDALIPNPMHEAGMVQGTMVVVFSEGKSFIGSTEGWQDDRLMNLVCPLKIVEGYVKDERSGQVAPQLRLEPVSLALGLIEEFDVYATGVYWLRRTSTADKQLVLKYEEAYGSMKASAAGLRAPTGDDISNLTRQVIR